MLVVYDSGLSGYHEIKPISYATEDWYNDIGKFTLVVAPSKHNISFLKKGAFLYRPEIKQEMVITRVSPDTSQNRITVNGFTANWMLNKRTLAVSTLMTNVETGIYAAITANVRQLPGIETAAVKGLTETHNAILYGGQMTDKFIEILDAVELGQRTYLNTATKKHVYEIYKGDDLTTGSKAVVFSEERGTARDLKIEDDESTFANVCYVYAELNDGTPIVRVVGNAQAGERYEHWLESRLKQNSDELLEDFHARMDSAGIADIAKRVRDLGFSVRVDPGQLGKAYSMGSKVVCVSKRFGISFTAKINGVKRTLLPQNETVNIVLGEPQLTVIGEIKLWLK